MAIETKRLLLRKPILEDFEGYWLMKNDEAACKYTGGITTYSYEERRKLYEKEWVVASQNTEFSIILKTNGEYIGYCGFIDDNKLLYGLKQNAWGFGYGYEAAVSMLSYGFTQLNLPYIVAKVNPQNIASEKILQKIGFLFDSVTQESGVILHMYKMDVADYPIA